MATQKSINPYTQELMQEFEVLNESQINRAIEKSNHTFKSWSQTSFSERTGLMHKLAEELRENKSKYARTISLEMGKVISESTAEIEKCALVCDYYATEAESFLADETLPVDEGEAYLAYDPIGTVLAIMPWNFPFWQVFRFAAPNIMAGNTGILKHAQNVPQCAKAIEEAFIKVGFPEYVFQSLIIESSQVNQIIDDWRVKAVTLTGSEKAGSKVGERAGKNIKKTVLELGGSDPYLILKDADLEKAAQIGVKARMINCGQSCIAAKRFIVEASVYDEYLELYQKNMNELKFGDPLEQETDYGAMARNDLAEQLEEQVQGSISKGAELLYGSGKIEREAIFKPSIIGNIKPDQPAYHEELFGPAAIFFSVKDENEAISVANNNPYGLGSAIWTKDIDKAKIMARSIESGSVFINSMVASNPKTPFGGIKNSGYGRELSFLGIREFMNQKTIWIK